MSELLLDKKVKGPFYRDPEILFPIARPEIGIPIYGFDLWRAYEFSWLNPSGKPVSGIIELIYPRNSRCIIESKSLKLYLNGLAFENFDSADAVAEVIRNDLSGVLDSPWIDLKINISDERNQMMPKPVDGICIDDIDINISTYSPEPSLLKTSRKKSKERLYSDLLQTNCPITEQPDRATVIVDYEGMKISHESLLAYICSFRDYDDFTESCCEKIFLEIHTACRPEKLIVQCLYTRRGGIDINPVRASFEIIPSEIKGLRHIRQ